MPFRAVFFWAHLSAGLLAGAVILLMSVTGVALTYEKQIIEWSDRRVWGRAPSAAGALAPETLLARVRQARPDLAPSALTLRADPAMPAIVAFDGGASAWLDPSTGAMAPTPTAVRAFFRSITNWHRWLALEGPRRAAGRAITGAANLAFLFIVLGGVYLWVPRMRTSQQFRQVLWFRGGLPPKARDFNWHHVIGIWSAVPLAIVVAGAVPISYRWASDLVYAVAGETPPVPASASPPSASRAGTPARLDGLDFTGLDAARRLAIEAVPAWRTMTLRVPREAGAPVTVAVDEGFAGQPQRRRTLTLSRGAGSATWETFDDLSPGRRLRSWLRFAHTGEYYGVTGQTIAGLVSAGAVVLAWTGMSLAWRRFRAWQARRRDASIDSDVGRAA